MRFARSVLLFSLPILSIRVLAQQQSPQPTQGTVTAVSLVQQSLGALTGGTSVTDVTLTGTVIVVTPHSDPKSGSSSVLPASSFTTESGTIALTATAAGQSQVIVSLPSGTRMNLRDYSAGKHTGVSTNPQGTTPERADNLVGPSPAWFYPAFILSKTTSENFSASYIGQETKNSAPVQHLVLRPPVTRLGPPLNPGSRVVGLHDVYLDPGTALPLVLVRNNEIYVQHPEKLAPVRQRSIYFPEEIRYSEYQAVQGMPVPFHIQVYEKDKLSLDIQLSSVSFNTGVVIPTPPTN